MKNKIAWECPKCGGILISLKTPEECNGCGASKVEFFVIPM